MRITKHIAMLKEFAKLKETIRVGDTPCSIFGVPESLKPHFAAALKESFSRPVIVVCSSQEKAESFAETRRDAVFIPKRPLQLRSSYARSREQMFLRIAAISKLMSGEAGAAFVCEESFCTRLIPKKDFENAHISIKKRGIYDPEELIKKLVFSG